MHNAPLLGCVLITGATAFAVVSLVENRKVAKPPGPGISKNAAPHRHQSPLSGFVASLDRSIIHKCLMRHLAGQPVNAKTLMECGDFDLYAEHMRLPKPYAVAHFDNILKHSTSVDSIRAQLQHDTNSLIPQVRTR